MTSPTRLHGLDAVRAGALLLGIVLHSLIPFTDIPWMINDSRTSLTAMVTVGMIHLFRMSLFMLLAGYFGRMVTLRRGARTYLKDRSKRILLPVFAFWPFAVFPLGILAGLAAAYRGLQPPVVSATPLQMLTPGQLWFLLVLFELTALVLAARFLLLRMLGAQRAGELAERVGTLLAAPLGFLLPAGIHLLTLLLQQEPPTAGIVAPTTIIPEPVPLLGYLGAFLSGWFLHASPEALNRIASRWLPMLCGGVALALAAWAPSLPGFATASLVAVASWLLVYGMLGLGVRFLNREHPGVRYLADASYWMYLMHLPLLVAIEIPLADLSWPILVKLAATWAITLALLLLSYHWLVRSTWLGAWLNGRRHPRQQHFV